MTTKELIERRIAHWKESKITYSNEDTFCMLCDAKIEELKIILNNLD